ncbi:hypothetical protein J6590_072544 [Homalodisca vitripennis]|nr:hypothetical protein J6590_072544 [Homalodisca vitripennis]
MIRDATQAQPRLTTTRRCGATWWRGNRRYGNGMSRISATAIPLPEYGCGLAGGHRAPVARFSSRRKQFDLVFSYALFLLTATLVEPTVSPPHHAQSSICLPVLVWVSATLVEPTVPHSLQHAQSSICLPVLVWFFRKTSLDIKSDQAQSLGEKGSGKDWSISGFHPTSQESPVVASVADSRWSFPQQLLNIQLWGFLLCIGGTHLFILFYRPVYPILDEGIAISGVELKSSTHSFILLYLCYISVSAVVIPIGLLILKCRGLFSLRAKLSYRRQLSNLASAQNIRGLAYSIRSRSYGQYFLPLSGIREYSYVRDCQLLKSNTGTVIKHEDHKEKWSSQAVPVKITLDTRGKYSTLLSSLYLTTLKIVSTHSGFNLGKQTKPGVITAGNYGFCETRILSEITLSHPSCSGARHRCQSILLYLAIVAIPSAFLLPRRAARRPLSSEGHGQTQAARSPYVRGSRTGFGNEKKDLLLSKPRPLETITYTELWSPASLYSLRLDMASSFSWLIQSPPTKATIDDLPDIEGRLRTHVRFPYNEPTVKYARGVGSPGVARIFVEIPEDLNEVVSVHHNNWAPNDAARAETADS